MSFEIGYLIQQVVTGEATSKVFDLVMNRVENETEIADLFQRAVLEQNLMDSLTNDHTLSKELNEEEERLQRELKNKPDLGLGL